MLANIVFGLFSLLGVFMMFIILLQRGRGGGLAGAFGGAGGQSAFGTRAGDVFTKITVVVAVLWVAMACASIFAFRSAQNNRFSNPKEKPSVKSTDGKDKVNNPFDIGTGDDAGDNKIGIKPAGDTKKEEKPKVEEKKKVEPKKEDLPKKEVKEDKKPSGPKLTPPKDAPKKSATPEKK